MGIFQKRGSKLFPSIVGQIQIDFSKALEGVYQGYMYKITLNAVEVILILVKKPWLWKIGYIWAHCLLFFLTRCGELRLLVSVAF